MKGRSKYQCLLLQTREVFGTRVFTVDRTDTRMKKFLDDNWAMVDWLVARRNRAIEDILCDDPEAADPLASADRDIPPPSTKRHRAEVLYTAGNAFVKIDVGGVGVSVVSVCNPREKLSLELSDRNVALLLETPPALEDEFPQITNPLIHWYATSHSVATWYVGGEPKRRRRKLVSVKVCNTRAETQVAIDKMVGVLAMWRDAHHDEPIEGGYGSEYETISD